MERIRVFLPTAFSFSTLLTVRITDLNYGGHVGNEMYLSLAHEARMQFLLSYGYSELNLEGVGIIIADAAIEYKRELKFGDQLKISVSATNFDKIGFDIHYKIEVKIDEEWLLAGKIKTGILCFDYATKKKVPVPELVITKMASQ